MKKTLSIILSASLALILFSGCNDSGTTNESAPETTIQSLDIVDNSKLSQRANAIKISLAKENYSQRALNQNTSVADVLYMLSEKSETVDEFSMQTYSLYNYFKENYVDRNVLSTEETELFNNSSITEINENFVKGFFENTNRFSDIDFSVYDYMKDELNTQDLALIKKHFFTIILDYPLMAEELASISYFSADDLNSTNNPLKESFYTVRINNAEIEPKLVSLLDTNPKAAQDLFTSLFNDEHKSYHKMHLDTKMYTSMIDALLVTSSYAISSSLVGIDSLTLPSDENASNFSKEFFNIGDTQRGDGNELATEKLLMSWSRINFIPPFELIGIDSSLISNESKSAYIQSDENRKTTLAYLDFMYMGLVPGADEADEQQADNFAYAREAGLNLRSAIRLVEAQDSSTIQKTGSLVFLQNYAFPLYGALDSLAAVGRTYDLITYDRVLPYMYQYIQASYKYYLSDDDKNKEEIKALVNNTLTQVVNNYEYYEYEQFSKQRSGGISFETIYLVLFEAYDLFDSLSLFDQMNLIVDYVFYNLNVTEYFPVNLDNGVELTNQYDLNASAYLDAVNDEWIISISDGKYDTIKLYNQDATWEYLPSNVSNLQYLTRTNESEAFKYNFNFDGGHVYLYFISTENTTQMQSYGFDIKRIYTDRIISENENENENEVYKLYRMKVYAKYEETYDFSELFNHVEAILLDTRNIYVPKTQATLDQEKIEAEKLAELTADTDSLSDSLKDLNSSK